MNTLPNMFWSSLLAKCDPWGTWETMVHLKYPLVSCYIAIENGHRHSGIHPLKMVIFLFAMLVITRVYWVWSIRVPSLGAESSTLSTGSVGHPLKCAAACKYVKRKVRVLAEYTAQRCVQQWTPFKVDDQVEETTRVIFRDFSQWFCGINTGWATLQICHWHIHGCTEKNNACVCIFPYFSCNIANHYIFLNQCGQLFLAQVPSFCQTLNCNPPRER